MCDHVGVALYKNHPQLKSAKSDKQQNNGHPMSRNRFSKYLNGEGLSDWNNFV